MNDAIQRVDPEFNAGNPIAPMLSAITKAGITGESVAALEKMTALYERMEDRRASQDFAAAFAALQAETSAIKPERTIPNRGLFAAFADLMAEVKPILTRHGFSVRFDTDYRNDPLRVEATCYLMHAGGHQTATKFAARVGKGVGGSDAQADGAAFTFAKRYALTAALNIVVDADADARALGQPITPRQADELAERAARVFGNDEAGLARFRRLCGADRFEDVTHAKLPAAIAELERREGIPAKVRECPSGYDDHDQWGDDMQIEMGQRWECGPSEAGAVLRKMIAAAEKASGPMDPERRKAAWRKLVSGELDAHRPKGGAA